MEEALKVKEKIYGKGETREKTKLNRIINLI